MVKIAICGINGQMGQVLSQVIAKHEDAVLTVGIDLVPDSRENNVPVYQDIHSCKNEPIDVIIDFSHPSALEKNLEFALEQNKAIVIATTGYTEEQKQMVYDAAKKIPVFYTANMSLGVNMQRELVKQVADFYGKGVDVEIIEKHHNRKVDAPSGTALMLADAVKNSFGGDVVYQYGRTPSSGRRQKQEIGLHAVRGGTIVGEHDVLFITDSEVLTVSHSAQSKQVFAEGAVRAAIFMKDKLPGLYNMKDIISQTRYVTNISKTESQAIISITNLPYNMGMISGIFDLIANEGINLDIINQTIPRNGHCEVAFSLKESDVGPAKKALSTLESQMKIEAISGLAKISVEGLGMELLHGVAAKLFSALAKCNAEVYIVSTDETKIAFCIKQEQAGHVIESIREAFQL